MESTMPNYHDASLYQLRVDAVVFDMLLRKRLYSVYRLMVTAATRHIYGYSDRFHISIITTIRIFQSIKCMHDKNSWKTTCPL